MSWQKCIAIFGVDQVGRRERNGNAVLFSRQELPHAPSHRPDRPAGVFVLEFTAQQSVQLRPEAG